LVTVWSHAGKEALQLLFGSQFERVYYRILNHRFEGHLDLALRVGYEPVEYLFDRVPLAGFLEDFEIVQQHRAVADDIEHSAASSALAAVMRAEKCLGEQQSQGVPAGWDGKAVAEVSVALRKEQFGVLGTGDDLAIGNLTAASIVTVEFPQIAGMIG
jgi:hypothetical protein